MNINKLNQMFEQKDKSIIIHKGVWCGIRDETNDGY